MATFIGGEKLKAYLAELSKKVTKSAEVRAGFIKNTKHSDSDLTYPELASVHEFGAPSRNIPPRPFMRPTVADGKDIWGDQLAYLLKANDFDSETSLAAMGEIIAGQIKEHIQSVTSPPLKKATIIARTKGMKKGKVSPTIAKPLIDTGELLNSVSSEVKS